MPKRRQHEVKLQKSIVEYLRLVLPRGAVFWHVPNGGMMTRAWRMILAALGLLPGVSDLMVFWRSVLLCIEVKTEADRWRDITRGKQSTVQKAFQVAIEAAGGHYAVVRSIDDVRAFLRLHGVPLREVVWRAARVGVAV